MFDRRWRRLVLGALLAWLVAAVAWLVLAVLDLRAGMDAAEAARRATPPELLEAAPLASLREAGERFGAAERRLSSAVLAPIRALPVIGRNLRAAGDLAGDAADVADLAASAVQSADGVVGAARPTPADRVAAVRDLGRVARQLATGLADVGAQETGPLLGPLADRRFELRERVGELRNAASIAADAADAVEELLQGPSRYLVLFANNAEMRAGSGTFLTAGILEFDAGELDLGELRPTAELRLEAEVPLPPELAANWGWLHPGREWRNLGTTPRFDVTAQLAADMWRARTGDSIDGVLALDVIALQAVLRATGPVDVGDRTVTAEQVVDLLLHDQYVAYGGDSGVRRELLGELADAALGAVQRGDYDFADLAVGLAEAARGRHLLLWSPDVLQRTWLDIGVAGSLDPDSLLVGVVNRGGNKLDRFLDVTVDLQLSQAGQGTDVVLTARLRNHVPAGEPAYVAGPHPEADLVAGEYGGILAFTIPGAAREVALDGDPRVAVAGGDGPSDVVAVELRIPMGASVETTLRFQLPPGVGLEIAPSARVPGIEWSLPGGQRWREDGHRVVLPDRTP